MASRSLSLSFLAVPALALFLAAPPAAAQQQADQAETGQLVRELEMGQMDCTCVRDRSDVVTRETAPGVPEADRDETTRMTCVCAKEGSERVATGPQSAERVQLNCLPLPEGQPDVTGRTQPERPGEERHSCVMVPQAGWTSVQDSMVLGRQATGVPTPDVDPDVAQYPDTSDTLTERQGIEDGQRWKGEPEDIGN